ncbi:MAG: hypothetical protein Q9187_000336 [Circinaria calcarea]
MLLFLVPRIFSEAENSENLNALLWHRVPTETDELRGVIVDTWDRSHESSLLNDLTLRVPRMEDFSGPGRRIDYTAHIKNSIDGTKEQDQRPQCAVERNSLVKISDGAYLEAAIVHQQVSIFDRRDKYTQALLDTAHTRNSCLSKSIQNCMALRVDWQAESQILVQRDIIFSPVLKNTEEDRSLPEGFYFVPAQLSITAVLDQGLNPTAGGSHVTSKSPLPVLDKQRAEGISARDMMPSLFHGSPKGGFDNPSAYTDHVARSEIHQTWLEAEKRSCMKRVCEGQSKGKLDFCEGSKKDLTVFQERTCNMCFAKSDTLLEQHCQSQVYKEAVAFYVLFGMLGSLILIGMATVIYHRVPAARRTKTRHQAASELPVVPLRREIRNPNMASIVEEDGGFLVRGVPKPWYRRIWPLSSTETVDLTAYYGGTAPEKPRGRWYHQILPRGRQASYDSSAEQGHSTENLQQRQENGPTLGPQQFSPRLPFAIGPRVSIDSEYSRFSRHPLAQINTNSVGSSRDQVDATSSLESRYNSPRVVSTGREADTVARTASRRTVRDSSEHPRNPPFVGRGMDVGDA